MNSRKNPYEFFDRNFCDLCGECLNKCPIFEFPIEEAKEEIKRLIEGEETKQVLAA